MKSLDPKESVIVALDVSSAAEALAIVDSLEGEAKYCKVGYQLFFHEGMGIVHQLMERGLRVFLDLKMGDIGNTMRAGLSAIPGEVALLTIQGDRSVCEDSVAALAERDPRPKLLLLTALSSSREDDHKDRRQLVADKTRMAVACGCDGVIASGEGVGIARQAGGEGLLIIVPGIRPAGQDSHEQKHVLTPAQAIRDGADMLVIGRAVTQAPQPPEALKRILEEISNSQPG